MSDSQPSRTAEGPDAADPFDSAATGAGGSAPAGWVAARPVPSLDAAGIVPPDDAPPKAPEPAMPAGTTVPAEPSAVSEPSVEAAVPGGVPRRRAQHAKRRRKHRIIVWSSVALLLAIMGFAGLVADQRIERPLPQPTVKSGPLASTVVPGSAPISPWPASGQGAVAVPSLGYAEQSGPEQPVPVASLTKMTTALVVLRDHPVPLGASGPTVVITPDEAAQFEVNLHNNETNIPLQAGEPLTELQLLEALLNQSADDAAYALGAWDAGSQQAFVAEMNAAAASLGAVRSHYVDASGFDPQSVSTAADTLRIAAAGMEIPTFAAVAGMPTVNLPGVGTVHNIVSQIGTDGIVGVKSGYTSQASGCMVLAGYRSVGGRTVLVLASALGQREPPPAPAPAKGPVAQSPSSPAPSIPPSATTTVPYSAIEAKYPLRYTEPIVEHLLDNLEGAIVPVPVVAAGDTLGSASTDWGGTRRVVSVEVGQGAWLLGVPGQRVNARMVSGDPRGAKTGSARVGTVRFTLGSQVVTEPVRLVRRIPDPGWWWKLLHN